MKSYVFILMLIGCSAGVMSTSSDLYAQSMQGGTEAIDTSIDERNPDVADDESQQEKLRKKRLHQTEIIQKRWENVQQMIQENPDNIAMLVEGGRMAMSLAKRPEAITYYRQAIELIRNDEARDIGEALPYQRYIIGMYIRDGKTNMAVVEYKYLCELKPDDIDLKFEFAEFLRNNGFPKRAFLVYEDILVLSPGNDRAINEIRGLYEQGYITKTEAESYLY